MSFDLEYDLDKRLRAAFPVADWWEVRGEGVVRGRVFQPNYWIYVLIKSDSLVGLLVTGEFIDHGAGAEEHVFRILVTGAV